MTLRKAEALGELVSDDEQVHSPSEYYTFDAVVNDPIEVVEAVLASKAGDHTRSESSQTG